MMDRWDPERAVALIERERVTFMIGPPTFFVSLMTAPAFTAERVASLRLVSSGGAGVSAAFVDEASERLGAHVKRTYGSTEAPTIATSSGGDSDVDARRHDGRAIGAVELRLAADGELEVRGPEVCVGYLDRAETAAAFTDDGWFRTGDLATLDDGWLTIVGRKKDVIIRGGENISTAEVESVLEAHPVVRQAATPTRSWASGSPRSSSRRRASISMCVARASQRAASPGSRHPNGSWRSRRFRFCQRGSRTATRYASGYSPHGDVSTPIIWNPLITARGFSVPGFQW